MKLTLWLILLIVPLVQGQTKKVTLPDEAAAVRRAEELLFQAYGKKRIESERPFKANLKDDVWTVQGTLHCSDGKGGTTSDCLGGTAEIRLSKTDGHVLFMMHTK